MLIMCSYINHTFLLTPQHQGGQEKNICSQHVTNAEILQIKASAGSNWVEEVKCFLKPFLGKDHDVRHIAKIVTSLECRCYDRNGTPRQEYLAQSNNYVCSLCHDQINTHNSIK